MESLVIAYNIQRRGSLVIAYNLTLCRDLLVLRITHFVFLWEIDPEINTKHQLAPIRGTQMESSHTAPAIKEIGKILKRTTFESHAVDHLDGLVLHRE